MTRRERLTERRKALGLTQEDLATVLKVERSTVHRWESGETAPAPRLRPKLARALKVSVDRLAELLEDDGSGRTGASAPVVTPANAVPRQLPPAVANFTGRTAELETLTRTLNQAGDAAGTVVISAIGGTAGVGKTALALHWAHQVAGRFPDGQLHVNLRGFDPSGTPATSAEAIRGFLDALGVPPHRLPPTPDAQAGLYRSLLRDRTMLIVLDNARDEQHARPLLPASPGSLVVITSRSSLTGLAATDGARLLSVDVLSHSEAVQLLSVHLGDRADAEPDTVTEIATLCACLPLALAVAAARAAARPRLPLAALAAELRDAAGRLDALDTGDPAASVGAVFSWSYEQLSDDSARMFRLLGLHPGPDISVPAAASLAATDQLTASRLLHELTRDCLLTEHVPGRFAFHDLLRAYAASQARAHDSRTDQRTATSRLLDHYLHTADAAAAALDPVREPLELSPPGAGVVPESPADYEQARDWFDAEYHVLFGVLALAESSGFDSRTWQLPKAMVPYLVHRGLYREWAAAQRTALSAAERLDDIAGQAICNRLLANACRLLADYDRAIAHHARSLMLYRRLGDRHGEALVHGGLCMVAEYQGRYADGLDHAEQAQDLYRALGDRLGEARALNAVGWFHALLGHYQEARTFCRQALRLLDDLGARGPAAHVWDSLGYIEHHLGNLEGATACYESGLSILRESGDAWNEAIFLTHLGDTRRAAGDLPQARDAWQRALAILDGAGHSSADDVRAKLAGL
jgi:transcriptional regulator with XRE-family HTH domain/tetratricopeptide (TPR) repeat protein